MKLCHFVQKMKKNTLKDGLDAKKDAKRDTKSNFCCSDIDLKRKLEEIHSKPKSIAKPDATPGA